MTNNTGACEEIVKDSEAELILVQNQKQLQKYLPFWQKYPKIKAIVGYGHEEELNFLEERKNVYTWNEFLTQNNESDRAEVQKRSDSIKPNECLTIVYTSGTTGVSKGVMLSHDNCMWQAHAANPAGSKIAKGQERILSYLPLSHVGPQ